MMQQIFSDKLLAIKVKKLQIIIDKTIYLGLSILEIIKIVMLEFRYNYLKPKYLEKTKLCYMDTDSFTVYIKTEDIYIDFAKDAETDLALQVKN